MLLCAIVTSLSCQNVYAAEESKKFKKITSGVTDIACRGSNIIYKKSGNAYVIGYDGKGCMGYGKDKIDNIKDDVVLEPNLLGKNVKSIYASFYTVAFLKKKNIYFCTEWIFGNAAAETETDSGK